MIAGVSFSKIEYILCIMRYGEYWLRRSLLSGASCSARYVMVLVRNDHPDFVPTARLLILFYNAIIFQISSLRLNLHV